jgi:ABC-type bacteriocin/lantibiotic exporter with double-glycine peptidase domain
MRIIKVLEEYSSYKISLERVEELFMISEEDFKNNYFYLAYDLSGDIKIKDLSYKIGYKTLFNKLNLTIKRGEKILLSGPSGCGKSTLVKMLMRYIEVDYNKINIASIDINHYHLNNIRTNITYLSSSEYLFNDTIKNNITLYKEYTEEEIEEVTKICLVNDIIKNTDLGLDKMIEENGFNFSSGEKQRIFLARSIIKKTNIYIFDEALGQIDINREKKILEGIFKYLKDKTVIVISHRFNNKKVFDRVLKLEEGKIIES